MKQPSYRPDIEIATPDGSLVVEVKERIREADEGYQVSLLLAFAARASGQQPTYALLVDPERMRFYEAKSDGTPSATLRTRDVLRKYDESIDEQVLYHSYLETLVQVWLNEVGVTPRADIQSDLKNLPATLLQVLNPA